MAGASFLPHVGRGAAVYPVGCGVYRVYPGCIGRVYRGVYTGTGTALTPLYCRILPFTAVPHCFIIYYPGPPLHRGRRAG